MRKRAMPILTMPNLPRAAVMASGIPAALRGGFTSQEQARALIMAAAGGSGDPETAGAIRELTTGLEGFKAKFEDRLKGLEAHLDDQARIEAAARLNGTNGSSILPVDADYTKAFASYARRGATDAEASLKTANATGERAAIQASMTEGDNSSGGYIAPVEWDRKIQKAERALSPMRRISQVVLTSRAAYSTLWSNDLWGSGWVGETATRPQTTTPQLAPLIIPAGEIYAMPAVTQRLLDDSAVNLDDWLATSLSDEFARQEGIAFVGGDGANKPMGFLQYVPGGAAAAAVLDGQGNVTTPAMSGSHPGGNLAVLASGNAGSIPNTDVLVDLKYGLGAPYRQNATWLMNSQTAAFIAKMKDGQGNYVWREALLAAEPSTLLGRPVEIDENMPNIGAGAMPIAFGDFQRGYVVNDRLGVRILRDPYTNKPFVSFYSTKRVGGGLLDPRAIRVLKVAAA